MRRWKRQEISADLSRAASRFAQWRQSRAKGARIPASLWDLAIKLAGQHGLSRTATALALDYYALKKRLAAPSLPVVGTGKPDSQPAFVELASSAWTAPGQCLIEFANAAGATLRVYLPGDQVPDLMALGRSFWDVR
jgi:hypothetical protein